MRVLHLDSGREMRGGQWQALSLMGGLGRLGHEQLLLARPGSPLERAARERSLRVEPLSHTRLLKHRRWADVIHAHDASTHTMAAVLALRPLVVSRRVGFPVKTGLLSRWKYGQADLYLAVSAFARERLLQAGVPAERVRVVYDGVELASPVDAGRDGQGVVALSSDDPGKCNDTIRAAATLGGFGVRFERDLPNALQTAGVLVYLSREEGLGSAALLAMAAGIPVLASDIPAFREVVVDGETGLLVHNEASAVSAAVQKLLSDDGLRRRMGAAGRRRVEERFLVRHMVEGTLSAYESL